jgi:hypothetical protein
MKEVHKKELCNVLSIPHVKQESVLKIMGRMDVLATYFEKHQPSFVPFLKTYYVVTRAVAEKSIHKGYFNNPLQLEVLDAYFASLYFKPVSTFVCTGKKDTPWETYFTYCKKKKGIPFVQMLLGINAHINTDLMQCIVDLNYKQREDYLKINTILKEVIPEVMGFLAWKEHDVFGLGGVVFRKFVTEEFKNIIVKWRLQAWDNAQVVRNHKHFHAQVVEQTEIVGKEIIRIFEDITFLHALPKAMKKLRGLRVEV